MKLRSSLLVLAAVFGLTCVVNAETSPINISIEKANKTESNAKDKSHTERRSLKITLSNSSKADVSVKVKYTWFGHGVTGHDVVIVDQGDKDATVKASGSEVVETAPTSVTFTDAHYDNKKKVEASGNKIIGYAVQVMGASGDKPLAEAYEPASMKDQVGKAVVAKKEEPKK